MSEPWGTRPTWQTDPDTRCGTGNTIFWLATAVCVGAAVGLVAWKLWGQR